MFISRHKTNFYLVFAVCCGLTAVSSNAHAQIFKWVDANGRTHYSDERPQDKGIKLQEIRIKRATNRITAEDTEDKQSIQATDQDSDALENDALEEDTDDTADQLLANQNDVTQQNRRLVISSKQSQQCTQARKHLAVLSRGMSVYLDDQDNYRLNWAGDTYEGERNYLSDDEIASARIGVKAIIKDSCKNPNNKAAQELARKKWINAEYCDMNRSILDDLQRADIKATHRQVLKQQELTAKYCEVDETLLSSSEYAEPELFPRKKR